MALATIAISSIHHYIKSKYSTNEEEKINYEKALGNFSKLKHLTITIVVVNTLCIWLFAMSFIYQDIYQSTLSSNAAQTLVHISLSLVAYRFLVSQSCLFPTDQVPPNSVETPGKSLGKYSMAKTKKFDFSRSIKNPSGSSQ